MIRELHIEDPNRTPVRWWSEILAFQGRSKFEFHPTGLTVLWGPNGIGKSSLLKMLARLTHCEQGGLPLVTEMSVDPFYDGFSNETVRDGASIKTDGKPVHYLDPGHEVGILGGSFDNDFGLEGMHSAFLRSRSSGQQVTARTNRILKSADETKEVGWKLRRERVNDLWKERLDQTTKFLTANIEEDGPPTLLLDEPSRSLAIPRDAETWLLLAQQERFQIIAATHSPFALGIPGVHYIDIQEGYLEECLTCLKMLGQRMDKKEAI